VISMPNPEQTNPYDVVAVLKQAARHPSEPPKRLAFPPRRSSLGRLALKGLIGLLVAAGIGAAAIVSLSDGDAAKQVIAQWWEPQLSLISSLAAESPVPVQSSPVPAVQEQLQSIARGLLAAVEDEMEQLKTSIEQLKTNQEQIVRDNAAVAEQLKATKEQSGRVIAKASEQQLQPKTPAPPRSIATPKGKTVPKQASAQPPVPVQGRPKQQ
jgi:outer membrane murein-binding lipoprotein Lpp